MHFLRRSIIAGLLVWLPIWVTLLVLKFIVDILNSSLQLLPSKYQPDVLLGFHVPGIGVILSILIILFTGFLVTNFLGKKLVHLGEAIVKKIPLVRTIYMATKQVMETVLSSKGESFRQVLLVEYPRKGLWSVAFQTGNSAEEIQNHVGEKMVTIFIPTTPNPTSGFLMVVPKKDVVELEMSVDQALKFIISLGVVQPKAKEVLNQPETSNQREKL